MFDLSKLGDMSKLASQAKDMQQKQEGFQKESLDMLKKVSKQLEEIFSLLKDKKQ